MKISELIDTVERIPEADRELDFWCWWWSHSNRKGDVLPCTPAALRIMHSHALPKYTDSVDAALGMIHQECRLYLLRNDCYDSRPAWVAGVDCIHTQAKFRNGFVARANYPALAIAAAALKARKVIEGLS